MSKPDPHLPQVNLINAISPGISTALSFLTFTNTLTHAYASKTVTLDPTLNGSHIIYHLKKDPMTSTQHTNCVNAMADPNTYAMMATLDTPIKVKLPTTITISDSPHQQIANIKFNPHNKKHPYRQSQHQLIPEPTHPNHQLNHTQPLNAPY